MTASPKQGGDGLRDSDKTQGDLRNDHRADRELPEGLQRERKGPVDKDKGREDRRAT